jgi:hypothetical protein
VRFGWRNSIDGFASLVDQSTAGRGTQPPEGPAFAAGAALSPMTPYDTFSSAPNTPGVAGIAQFTLLTQYFGRRINASLQSGVAYVDGSVTNASYWTESLMPTFNPHLGSQALPYAIVFPTHADQDDAATMRASILSGSVGAREGTWNLRGGWFDLTQGDRFVFVQPALTNQTPSIAVQTAESLGNGPPTIDGWPNPPPGLPLHGVDLTLHHGFATAELTSAALPSLPGTSARISLGSIVFDRGTGTRFSADLLHLVTGGDFLNVTTLFGENPTLNPGPQGPLPTSVLGAQVSTIAGLHAVFPVATALNATLEYGRAWYTASHVFAPGTERPGNYYHFTLTHPFANTTVAFDGYKFEPRYATAIVPYGAPENVWSVAWSWPGIWLKSTYQLADNTSVGANRQGFRVRYGLDRGPVELHTSFAQFRQIDPNTIALAQQVGFVEGFFLPQQPNFETFGDQKQYAAWIAWHPPYGNITLDFVDDMMHRDAAVAHPEDAVTYDAPQAVLSFSRMLNKNVLAAVGAGRYAMAGSWAHGPLTNVDYQQQIVFAGAQIIESKHAVILVQLRSSSFSGKPSIIGGPSPNYTGSLLVLEQRFHS